MGFADPNRLRAQGRSRRQDVVCRLPGYAAQLAPGEHQVGVGRAARTLELMGHHGAFLMRRSRRAAAVPGTGTAAGCSGPRGTRSALCRALGAPSIFGSWNGLGHIAWLPKEPGWSWGWRHSGQRVVELSFITLLTPTWS